MEIIQDIFSANGKNYHLFFHDSMRHLVESSEALKPGFDGANHNGKEWTYGRGDFDSRDKTKAALLAGSTSDAILAKVAALREKAMDLDSIQALSAGFKKKRSFAEAGAELSIDRVLCGDPMHWETRAIQKRKTVRLAINYALSAGNGDDDFYKLAALSIVAADLLSKAGFSVEILALSVVHNAAGGKYAEGGGVVKLKDAAEPLDIARICAIGISGMYRTYTFSLWEAILGAHSGGYGNCIATTSVITDRLEINHMIETKWIANERSQTDLLNNIFKSL